MQTTSLRQQRVLASLSRLQRGSHWVSGVHLHLGSAADSITDFDEHLLTQVLQNLILQSSRVPGAMLASESGVAGACARARVMGLSHRLGSTATPAVAMWLPSRSYCVLYGAICPSKHDT